MKSELVRIHHAQYEADLPFWMESVNGLDPILEIGCGHGRVSLPLLEAGHTVVGIDIDSESQAFLSAALEELGDAHRRRISLVLTDILDYQPAVLFGAVIVPCNTYSTFDAGARLGLLEVVYSCLKEGGVFIASIPNPLRMREIYDEVIELGPGEGPDPEEVISHPETGFPVQVSSRFRVSRNSLLWDWIYDHLHPDGNVERMVATVEHFLAAERDLKRELDRTGFKDVTCLGDFTGEAYSEISPYLILVCRKQI